MAVTCLGTEPLLCEQSSKMTWEVRSVKNSKFSKLHDFQINCCPQISLMLLRPCFQRLDTLSPKFYPKSRNRRSAQDRGKHKGVYWILYLGSWKNRSGFRAGLVQGLREDMKNSIFLLSVCSDPVVSESFLFKPVFLLVAIWL